MEEIKMGRPKKYSNVEDMQRDINKYFESCYRVKIKYKSKIGKSEVIKDEKGNPIYEQYRPFTITGLADALDMSRQTLLNYSEEEDFFDTITRAKRKCEMYAEENLYNKEKVNGAKFSLANNFKDWKDKKEIKADVDSKVKIEDYLKKVEGDEY